MTSPNDITRHTRTRARARRRRARLQHPRAQCGRIHRYSLVRIAASIVRMHRTLSYQYWNILFTSNIGNHSYSWHTIYLSRAISGRVVYKPASRPFNNTQGTSDSSTELAYGHGTHGELLSPPPTTRSKYSPFSCRDTHASAHLPTEYIRYRYQHQDSTTSQGQRTTTTTTSTLSLSATYWNPLQQKSNSTTAVYQPYYKD